MTFSEEVIMCVVVLASFVAGRGSKRLEDKEILDDIRTEHKMEILRYEHLLELMSKGEGEDNNYYSSDEDEEQFLRDIYGNVTDVK